MNFYHGGDALEPAKLPYDWTPTKGLRYPTFVNLASGRSVKIVSYKEHHQLISFLVKGTKLEININL